MIGDVELLRALTRLERTLDHAADLRRDQRVEMIQMRRSLSDHYTAIAALGHAAFDKSEAGSEFQRQLSKVRWEIAMHQSVWPVVSADFDDPEYIASLNTARDANRAFIDWIRTALTTR